MAINTHQSKSPFTYVLNTAIIKEHIHKFITLQVKLKVRCTCLCLIFNFKKPIEIYFLSPKPLKSVLFYCSNYKEQCFKRLYKNSPRQIPSKVISLLVNSCRVNSHLIKFLFHEFPPGEFTSSCIPLHNFSLETSFSVKNGLENKLIEMISFYNDVLFLQMESF